MTLRLTEWLTDRILLSRAIPGETAMMFVAGWEQLTPTTNLSTLEDDPSFQFRPPPSKERCGDITFPRADSQRSSSSFDNTDVLLYSRPQQTVPLPEDHRSNLVQGITI